MVKKQQRALQIREKHGITHQKPMFCQVFLSFQPLRVLDQKLLILLVVKTLGLDKKNFYPIFCVFSKKTKNILSYPQFTAYFLSSVQKTKQFFISTMRKSFRC